MVLPLLSSITPFGDVSTVVMVGIGTVVGVDAAFYFSELELEAGCDYLFFVAVEGSECLFGGGAKI